jgi:predicted O-methyltransferase YrrM
MTQALYADVDHYLEARLLPRDEALESTLANISQAGVRPISVAPNQGKMLAIFARMVDARRILEIGTLGGYSTIWLGSALPAGGSLVTLEIDPRHAEIARENIERAGLRCSVDLRVGAALALLPPLEKENGPPFDLCFIDADKENIPSYFNWALRLSRPGSVIVVDNVVRQGRILNTATDDPQVRGVQNFFDRLAAEPRVYATAIQTVGSKGHDGFLIAHVS